MNNINQMIRLCFFIIIVRPIVWLLIGFNICSKVQLPKKGSAIIVANHNSHLDTLVLISLLPLRLLHKVQPVAAADYFLTNPITSWFSKNIIGILPIQRSGDQDPLKDCQAAMKKGKILIFFPEGSRGKPEKMVTFKFGIAKLARLCPEVPVYPVYLHGLGKALPKGQLVLVPFFCDVVFAEPIYAKEDEKEFYKVLVDTYQSMQHQIQMPTWD